MPDVETEAHDFATSFIDGNRNMVCVEILNGKNPAVMAARVALLLLPTHHADSFVRILEENCEN